MYSYCIPNTSLLTYSLYNPNFKVVEFDHFKKEAGLPTFTMSVGNWGEKTNAIGIISISGKSLRKLSVPRPHPPTDVSPETHPPIGITAIHRSFYD